MSELKLIPCPHCGGKVKIRLSGTKKTRFVSCDKCHISTFKFKTREAAVREWNKIAARIMRAKALME